MSATSKYTALIARLEAATEPDRELDCDIFVATAESPFVSYYPECVLASQGGFSARLEVSDIRPYTTSIDAALTLVPEGLSASATRQGNGRGAAEIWRWAPEKFADITGGITSEELRRRNGSFTHQNIGALTPAIALCIAALRAREATP